MSLNISIFKDRDGLMWSRRKKDNVSDEDAELRALLNTYAQLHVKKDSSLPTQPKSPKTKSSSPQLVSPPTQQSSMDPLPELPMDDVIPGSSFHYTRAEAKIYANEEPCDTWRHFDEWFHHNLPLHAGSDYYRYGVRRSPVPYWKELRFCISTKSMTPLEAKIAIGRRRHEKLARLRQQGCSEDFWEIRTEPLKNPFPLAANQMTEEEKEKGKLL